METEKTIIDFIDEKQVHRFVKIGEFYNENNGSTRLIHERSKRVMMELDRILSMKIPTWFTEELKQKVKSKGLSVGESAFSYRDFMTSLNNHIKQFELIMKEVLLNGRTNFENINLEFDQLETLIGLITNSGLVINKCLNTAEKDLVAMEKIINPAIN